MAVVPSLPTESTEIRFSAVNPEIQTFISDIMYRTYFSKASEVRTMISGNSGLSADAMVDIIIGVFNTSVTEILPFYDGILNASLTVNDYYITESKLKLDTTILVTTINPQIFEEVTVVIRF